MRHLRSIAMIVALTLFAAACGGSSADTTATAETSTETVSVALSQTVSGSQLDLGSLEGQDTVLWFWAPW